VNINGTAFDDEIPEDPFWSGGGELPDWSISEHLAKPQDVDSPSSSRMHRFFATLRDSFELSGFDSPIYPFSEH
jgi:hypothetical protein